MRHGDGCGRFLGICALGLGLGILIAAIFPVGVLMFLVSFLLIACGIVCLKDRRSWFGSRPVCCVGFCGCSSASGNKRRKRLIE